MEPLIRALDNPPKARCPGQRIGQYPTGSAREGAGDGEFDQRRRGPPIVKDISPNAWQHVHLIGAFNFELTESQIDIDALVARYDDPDFWNRAVIEAPGDSLA